MEVIRVENLCKLYDLGQVGTGTLSKDLNRWWARARGKQDPYARLGQTNERTKKAGKDESVWALKDITFSINQGEVVGIIGRNGAGKSTLLKIISRITTPTDGTVKVRGRIASLLEVGTGFHPEMTGRENIFMNGTLLGMTRKEIQRKLDEIIDFAGVALYIDTPVKRYSSGMQVRLAFAVGAFLEPEILIVDEVLAVGDAEFQKKAIGRMREVSKGHGRTVLFVSHNMGAVSSLCRSGILLVNGEKVNEGTVDEVITSYLHKTKSTSTESKSLGGHLRTYGNVPVIKKGWFEDFDGNERDRFEIGENVRICFQFDSENTIDRPLFGFGIENALAQRVFSLNNEISGKVIPAAREGTATCEIEYLNLLPGKYYVSLSIVTNQVQWVDYIERALEFEIIETDFFGTGKMITPSQGLILLKGVVNFS